MEPSIKFSWNCTSRLPYFYFTFTFTAIRLTPGTLTKVSTGGSVNRQPRRGRRMTRKSSHPNLRSMPLWKLLVDGQAIIHLEARCESSQSYIFCLVGWVEACLTADLPSILQLSFLRTFVVVLVSCLDSAVFMEYSLDPSIIWGGWTFGGRVKVIFANWVHFQTSYFSKRQNSVDGFKIQKNQQSKQDFLSEFCFDSHHYEWKCFS